VVLAAHHFPVEPWRQLSYDPAHTVAAGGTGGRRTTPRGRSRCPSTDEGRSKRLPARWAGVAVDPLPSPRQRAECSRSPCAAACVMIPPPKRPHRNASRSAGAVRYTARSCPGFAAGPDRARGGTPF